MNKFQEDTCRFLFRMQIIGPDGRPVESAPRPHREVPRAPQVATIIEFTHRVTSGLALLAVVALVVWTWRVTVKRNPARKAAVAALILMLNEAWLGALLVLLQRVGQDSSVGRAVLLSLHFANTFLLLASIALCARASWARKPGRPRRTKSSF